MMLNIDGKLYQTMQEKKDVHKYRHMGGNFSKLILPISSLFWKEESLRKGPKFLRYIDRFCGSNGKQLCLFGWHL